MARTCFPLSGTALVGVLLALVALIAGAGPAATPPPAPTASSTPDDQAAEARRKAEVLASSRWRRAMHELDGWLATQPVYTADRVARIKADLVTRVAGMTSYELDYMLDGLDEKLQILESPAATDVREWLGRYLAVMADDRRAALVADAPDLLKMSAAELTAKLTEIEEQRAKVERAARDARTSRREFGAFVAEARRSEAAEREQLDRVRHGTAAFSPYRTQPAGSPPFPDTFDSPTVVGVGPWGTFVDVSFAAF
jgi:hypothetical protein